MRIIQAATVLLLFIVSSAAKAQVIDDNAGKTYYYHDENTRKKVKEIYHHKQIVRIMPDPQNHGSYIDTFLYVKNGPYTSYDESGNLICSGYYIEERKDSVWKYYNPKGDMIRMEKYQKGRLLKQ
jgi:antitoxin component YwqK of YwqJK toxin-antitoxin module